MFPHFDQSEYAVALKNAYRQFPAKYSTLDIDFINNRQRVAGVYGAALDGVTFTRSTTATYFGADGTLKTAVINEPRFEYDPVLRRPMGLLIEESRANSLRNNTMQGAVAGTPGTLPTNWTTYTTLAGLTRTVVGSGIISGISYVDIRVSGTPSGSGDYGVYFEASNAISATNGQTWAQSVFLAVVGGSTANVGMMLRVDENTAAGAFVANKTGPSLAVTSTLSRAESGALTLNGGATVGAVLPWLRLTLTAGSAVNITLRIGLPQLELGAFATSVIPTSGTAATRGADVASMTGANFSSWYNASEGTLILFQRTNNPSSAAYSAVIRDSAGALQGGIGMYYSSNSTIAAARVRDFSAGHGSAITTQSVALGARCIAAMGYTAANTTASASINGSGTVTGTGAPPPASDTLFIGSNPPSLNALNGYIERLIYNPKLLPNNLQQYLSRPNA